MATKNSYQDILNNNLQVHSFALALLRDRLLTNLLQEDYAHILYWSGKELARQFPTETFDDIRTFFENAGFGDLTLTSQDSKNQKWQLDGAMVLQRLQINNGQADFSLEAGFLAQQLETQTDAIAEATFIIDKKTSSVAFEVVTDLNQRVEHTNFETQVASREQFLTQTHATTEQAVVTPQQAPAASDTTHFIDASLSAFKHDEPHPFGRTDFDSDDIDPFNAPTQTEHRPF